jgi:ribose-phosphate pyrophosphokinase
LHRTADLTAALGAPAIDLLPVDLLAAALPRCDSPLVIGPDAESAPWAKAWADRLRGRWVALAKTRRGDRDVSVELAGADIAGRPVVIVDDVAASGETIERATELARKAGAASIDIAVVHALMDEAATQRVHAAGARRIVSTDSVRHPTNAARLAPMLAEAVREVLAA